MKKIRNWKIAMREVDTKTALEVLEKQVFNVSRPEPTHGPFSIQSMKTRKVLDYYDPTICLRCDEASNLWYILEPDEKKEDDNNTIRNIMKKANNTGLTYAAIDNMTISELWKHFVEHVNDEQMFEILKWYFDRRS